MNILAIETSSAVGSVALLTNDSLVVEVMLDGGSQHSRNLVPSVASILPGGVSVVDLIAVSIGPGSYTGLRVGITFAKMLAMETGKPMVGVSSLDVVAGNVAERGPLCVAVDARLGQVCAALYDGERRKVLEDTVAAPSDVAKQLQPGTWVVGDALRRYANMFRMVSGVQIIEDETLWQPRAVNVGVLGAAQCRGGVEVVDPRAIVPRYLRSPQAGVKWETS